MPGYTDDFHIGGLDVSASKTASLAQLAVRLAEAGKARLEPYLWAARQAVRQKAAANAAMLDTRGQALHNRGLKRVEPFLVASRRQVTEAVKLLSGGVADGSAKVPLVSSAPTVGSVFDEGELAMADARGDWRIRQSLGRAGCSLYGEAFTLIRAGESSSRSGVVHADGQPARQARSMMPMKSVGLLRPTLTLYLWRAMRSAAGRVMCSSGTGGCWTVRKTLSYRVADMLVVLLALCD